jgi:hypothetical protein
MDFVFIYSNGASFEDKEQDHFNARVRSRIQIDFIANENLRGVLMLQIGRYNWGGNALDGVGVGAGAVGTTNGSPLVRRLYLDFNFPDSPVNVKMGLMDLVLPYVTFGQPVFGDHVAAVTMTANVTDNAALTAFWARPYHDGNAGNKYKNADMDVFGLWANLDFDTFTVAPWATYASIGSNTQWWENEYGYAGAFTEDDDASVWNLGVALKVMPSDALTIKFDAMYGKMNGDLEVGGNEVEGSGYYFALAVDYALDWGTPGFFAIYSSGDKEDDAFKMGRMPVLAHGDAVYATRMAFGGSMTCGEDTVLTQNGIGMWVVGLQLADLSFIENVNHVARLAYMRGTNDEDSTLIQSGGTVGNTAYSLAMSTKDSAWEVGFDTYWQMYENLTVGLELGYIHLDINDDHGRDDKWSESSAYSGNLIFRFGF